MEQRNYLLLRIIVAIELSIIFFVTVKILSVANKRMIPLESDFSSIDEKISYYKNIDESIKNKYEEYTDNISKLEKKIQKKEAKVKIAYLTFDDGPYDQTTKILDVLKKNDARATFFTLGKKDYIKTYQRIVNEDHVLANHTYYHNIRSGLYKSVSNFTSQIKKHEDFLYGITGYKTTLLRFPGGSSTAGKLKSSIVSEIHKMGYKYVDWNCQTGDGSDKMMAEHDAFYWYKNTCTQNIIVILMHDYNYSTYSNLDKIIKDLRERNYLILPLTNKSVMAQ